MPPIDAPSRLGRRLVSAGVLLSALLGIATPSGAQSVARVELPNGTVAKWSLTANAEISAVSFDDSDPLSWAAAGTRPSKSGSAREAFVVLGRGLKVEKTFRARERGEVSISEPTPLLAAGTLRGLAWFRQPKNGDARAASLVVAPFNGRRFGRPKVISPQGPGSQLALAAAPLGAREWVLAWSRFDGQDDEIAWSRGTPGGSWSKVQIATANEVPDITPTLAAHDGGVMLSWARFESGNYRVAVSRFEDGRFAASLSVGAAGSVFPSFLPKGSGRSEETFLLYRTARPRGWEVAEIDRVGQVMRRAAISGEVGANSERPRVTLAPSGVGFRWASASDDGDDGNGKTASEGDSTFAPWQEERP